MWKPRYNIGDTFAINRASQQARGLVSWWPGQASGGRRLLSDCNNLNTMAYVDVPTWRLDGQRGAVLSYDGSNDAVQCSAGPTNNSLPLGDFSVSAWINLDTVPGNNVEYPVAAKHNWNKAWLFDVYGVGGGNVKLYANVSNDDAITSSSSMTLTVGTWYHVVFVFTGLSDKKTYTYKNGVQTSYASQTDMGSAYVGDTSTRLQIGATQGPFNGFDGAIDDVRIYRCALSPAVIWQMYDPATRWDLYEPVRRLWVAYAPPPVTPAVGARRQALSDIPYMSFRG